MSEIIIITASIIYAIIATIIELAIKRNRKISELYKEMEKYSKENKIDKVLECQIRFFRISSKYIFVNIFAGILIFYVLWMLLGNFKIYLPYLNLEVSWVLMYILIVFLLTLMLKYFTSRIILKIWGRKK
ncbi:MAG: hypothetical protein QXP52_00610 [Candidatus Aenigmatarchaeota archaeon]